MQTFLPALLPSIQRYARSVTLSLVLALFALVWLAPLARAQVTVYTDEASFNAASASLNFLLEDYEGIAPAGENGYPANLVSPGADIFSPFSVSNADVYTTSTPQYLEVDDAAYNKLSLNGTACLTVVASFTSPPTVTMTTDNAATTAFGTEIGLRDPYGAGVYDDEGGGGGPGYYPLTDTVDVQLYLYNDNDQSITPVGDVVHLGSVDVGYIGVVSTLPFNRVSFVFNHTVDYTNNNGYTIPDPYQMTWDNSRFGAPPTLPTVTVAGSDPNAEITPHTNGAFVVTLSAAAATDLQIAYTVKGSATPGVDYKKLPGTVTIPAGATSAKIKVKPKGNLSNGGAKVVKLTLQAGTGYLIGTPDPVKVKIKP